MIKVVSFDIGGTLIKSQNNDDSAKYDLNALSNLIGMQYEDVRRVYKNVFQRTEGTFDQLLDLFCENLIINRTNKLEEFFTNKFKKEDNNFSIEDIGILKKLKDMGYKVILFSNSCSLIENNISVEVKNIVDGIFYSYKTGYTKSESESYKYIEETLGYEPNNFLHIGDTLKSDYNDPIKYGWNALYYGHTEDKSVRSIKSLNEIFNYLKD